MRPPAPILSDDPIAFVMQAIKKDMLARRPNLRSKCNRSPILQDEIMAFLAMQMYGDALAVALLLHDEIVAAKRAEEEMFGGKQ